MRVGQKVQPTVQVQIADVLCDLCGASTHWHKNYDASEVTLEARIGKVYPELDDRRVHSADVCADCFLEKVKPALEAIGLRFQERDADDYDPRYSRVLELDEKYTPPTRKDK